MSEDKQKFETLLESWKTKWKTKCIAMTDHDNQMSDLTKEFTQRDSDLQARVNELEHQLQQLRQNHVQHNRPPEKQH